jgi:hypothetical protein
MARGHGLINVANGLWPLAHLRSFEKVFGPKTDEWLVYTVSGLLLSAGGVQLSTSDSQEGNRLARRVGLGTAFTLLAIDLIYVPAGRIRATYLIDAAVELALIAGWAQTYRGSRQPN